MTDGYSFVPIDFSVGGLAAVSALLRRVFPRSRHLTPTYLDWLYAGNPDGEALGFNAFFDGRLVGHCAGLPLVATIDGTPRRGIILVNAAVDRDHRRRNITRRTTDPMFSQAAGAGFHFAISTGNRYSTLPLLTRFTMIGQLEARIGFGAPARRRTSILPSFERQWSGPALRWRLANPAVRYSVRRSHGCVCAVAPAGVPGLGATLVDALQGEVAESGPAAPLLRVWLGLDPAVEWRRSAFVPIPARLRPSPLNLLFKDLTGGAFQPDPQRVLFRAIDFDAY
jgi:GNAT superfamily N-acetyltransferase